MNKKMKRLKKLKKLKIKLTDKSVHFNYNQLTSLSMSRFGSVVSAFTAGIVAGAAGWCYRRDIFPESCPLHGPKKNPDCYGIVPDIWPEITRGPPYEETGQRYGRYSLTEYPLDFFSWNSSDGKPIVSGIIPGHYGLFDVTTEGYTIFHPDTGYPDNFGALASAIGHSYRRLNTRPGLLGILLYGLGTSACDAYARSTHGYLRDGKPGKDYYVSFPSARSRIDKFVNSHPGVIPDADLKALHHLATVIDGIEGKTPS